MYDEEDSQSDDSDDRTRGSSRDEGFDIASVVVDLWPCMLSHRGLLKINPSSISA
jgi:hypothetical protein